MAADAEVARLGAELTPLSLELEGWRRIRRRSVIEQYQQLSSGSRRRNSCARRFQTEAFWALNL